MRILFLLLLAAGLAGCKKDKAAVAVDKAASKSGQAKVESGSATPSKPKKSAPPKDEGKPVITPSEESAGRVAMVNQNARFVVLTYSEGAIPAAEQKLSLYRNGLKVAEVKVTGPQRDNNTVADITAGDAQVNDEVRR